MALIIPEIFAEVVNEKLGVSLKMAQLATDVTNEVADITTCGDKIHFPSLDRVAKVGEVTKGTALVPSEISMTDSVATIKQTGGSVRVYDKDSKQIKGSTMDKMAQQLADAMVQDLDSSLSNTMDTEATKKSPCANATSITNDELLNGFALFGDDVDYDTFAGIAINADYFLRSLKWMNLSQQRKHINMMETDLSKMVLSAIGFRFRSSLQITELMIKQHQNVKHT